MAVDERSRHALHTKLQKVLGEEEAVTMMELVPPVGWGEVATKRDLDELRVATKRDLDELRVATKRDLDGLRSDFRDLKSDFGELRRHMDSQFRTTLFSFVTVMIGLAGLVFVAARLA
ncbi:MAG: hypothetical protein ACR2FO_08655 [Actinomycetota bacterium]